LILVDYNVPRHSGIEILVMAENEFKTANLTYPKVIMLTAKDDPELKNTLYREKLIHGFFNKPVPIDILEDKIREILKI
jgi:response regulator RpfG family c-di-GMP phosphodiesterase